MVRSRGLHRKIQIIFLPSCQAYQRIDESANIFGYDASEHIFTELDPFYSVRIVTAMTTAAFRMYHFPIADNSHI